MNLKQAFGKAFTESELEEILFKLGLVPEHVIGSARGECDIYGVVDYSKQDLDVDD